MVMALRLVAAAVVGYLLGSISSAVVLSYIAGKKDVRNYGSHNAGATNMARVFGMGLGVATLLLDVVKTAGSMLLGRLIGGEYGFLLAGGTCLLGHCFPVLFRFKGGKGVAVGAAIGLMLDWRILVLLVTIFFVVFLFTKRVSVCSSACALSFVPLELLVGVRGTWHIVLGGFATVCVLFMHRENIRRLIRGEEPKFKPKTNKKEK